MYPLKSVNAISHEFLEIQEDYGVVNGTAGPYLDLLNLIGNAASCVYWNESRGLETVY